MPTPTAAGASGGGGKPAAAAPTDAVAAAFYYHDDNYSGFLDYRELSNALQTMGINVHMGTSIEILRRYDDTPDGKLDLAEFRQLCSDLNGENGAGNAAPPKPPRPYSGARVRREHGRGGRVRAHRRLGHRGDVRRQPSRRARASRRGRRTSTPTATRSSRRRCTT